MAGLYSFSYEIIADYYCLTSYTCVDLYVDSVAVSYSCSVWPNSAGTAVTVQLTAVQGVKLTTDHASCKVIGDGSLWNKFSGHLPDKLYQIN